MITLFLQCSFTEEESVAILANGFEKYVLDCSLVRELLDVALAWALRNLAF
jgi:hypothetical protein